MNQSASLSLLLIIASQFYCTVHAETAAPTRFSVELREGMIVLPLGAVKPKVAIPIEVSLGNEMAQRVTLREIETTCGCTKVALDQQWIPPRSSTTVKVDLVSSASTGEFAPELKIKSRRDGKDISTTLRFKLHTRNDVELVTASRVWKVNESRLLESAFTLSLRGYHGTDVSACAINASHRCLNSHEQNKRWIAMHPARRSWC